MAEKLTQEQKEAARLARREERKHRRLSKGEPLHPLPEEYVDFESAAVKTEIQKLKQEVATAMAVVIPKRNTISALEDRLAELGDDCKHENLVAEGTSYKCANPACGEIINPRPRVMRAR